MNPCRKPSPAGWAPELNHGLPKPILNAYRTQMMITTAKVANVSIMLLIDQRFCITPPYSTTRPGTLINPTNVAAVNCQAVSPVSSQCTCISLLSRAPNRQGRWLDPLSQADPCRLKESLGAIHSQWSRLP